MLRMEIDPLLPDQRWFDGEKVARYVLFVNVFALFSHCSRTFATPRGIAQSAGVKPALFCTYDYVSPTVSRMTVRSSLRYCSPRLSTRQRTGTSCSPLSPRGPRGGLSRMYR